MEVRIEKLVFGGKGLANHEGRTVFVPLTAPGDLAKIEIVKENKDFDEGKLVELIEPAKIRVSPKCPVFGKCGGCQWQHLSYDAQLKWKKKIIIETWERIAKKSVEVEDVIPSEKQWHYRNRIQLHVNVLGKIGFHASSSHKIVEFDKCLIADERLNKQLDEKRDIMKAWRKGLGLKIEDERDCDGSFAQVNTLQNENLKKIVRDFVKKSNSDFVLELYSGGGNLTFAIADTAKKIVASDIDKRAVAGANERVKAKEIENVEFEWGDAEKITQNHEGEIDLVLLDPPRIGAKDTIKWIAKANPKNIIYVSCDPATLARDSIKLFDAGYEIIKCQPLDMFPQTFHVENVALFELKKS